MYTNNLLNALAANPNVQYRASTFADVDANYINRRYRRVVQSLDLIQRLALERPTWKFLEGNQKCSSDYSDQFIINDADDKFLGKVWVDYEGYHAENHRTAKQAPNKGHRSTKDRDKAVAIILKNFGHATHKEIVDAKFHEVYNSIDHRYNRLSERSRTAMRDMEKLMLAFCRQPEVFNMFVAHANADPAWSSVLNIERKVLAMLQNVEAIKTELHRGTATLILRVEGEYIVRRLDNVSVYNDTTLPMEFREQLGMLKLSDVDKYLEGIGVRVAEDVFVLGAKDGATTNE